jgi:hypothetical protein
MLKFQLSINYDKGAKFLGMGYKKGWDVQPRLKKLNQQFVVRDIFRDYWRKTLPQSKRDIFNVYFRLISGGG